MMRIEKKRILKEDGRYLVYYHFPETAAPAETDAFTAVKAVEADQAATSASATAVKTDHDINIAKSEEPPRV